MKSERYMVFLLQSGSMMFWTGHRWDLRPYNAKCYGVKAAAEKAKERASKTAPEDVTIIQATLIT